MAQGHGHDFAEAEWPFADPPNVAAITTVNVLEGGAILLVTHEADDGSWQVLCGRTNDPDDGRVMCLGCLFQRDRSLGGLADLPLGWRAWREAEGFEWKREVNVDAEE